MLDHEFDQLRFLHPLRGYQKEIIELVHTKLAQGERELNIVAPPGAGKTIIGLQLICDLKIKTLVLCPNTTIQNQWIKKLDLFISPESLTLSASDLIGKGDKKTQPITVVTYQALSTPEREQELIINSALSSWLEEVKGDKNRIDQMRDFNPKAYERELARHKRRARRHLIDEIEIDQVLHPKAMKLINKLKEENFGLIVLDECHHLTDYWASIISKVIDYLGNPLIIGLTATPPEGKSNLQKSRYLKLVGEIDYEVPTPALVKDGSLAPFQDLVYFTSPSKEESQFISEHADRFKKLIDQINQEENFKGWLYGKSVELKGDNFLSAIQEEEELTIALCRAFWHAKLELPELANESPFVLQEPSTDDWLDILEVFCLNYLKISPLEYHHDLLSQLKKDLGELGFKLSETGINHSASTVDKTLSLSVSKAKACLEILAIEYKSLEGKLRAAIVCDFEASAQAAYQAILEDNVALLLRPILVTGTKLYIDPSIQKKFLREAKTAEFKETDKLGISVKGVEHPVRLVTALLEKGVTQCIIGTRGILGEGWDSPSLNTLIDLTAVTTPTSVKQLRGRSLRKIHDGSEDLDYQQKVANNWDIVCIYPVMEKGLNDFARFDRKHKDYLGLSWQDTVESGIKRLHPAFLKLSGSEILASQDDFNQEMLDRAIARDTVSKRWKIGEPYENKSRPALEIAALPKLGISPPFIQQHKSYQEHRQQLIYNRSNFLASSWVGCITVCILAYIGLTSAGFAASVITTPILLFLAAAAIFLRFRYGRMNQRFSNQLLQKEDQIQTVNRILQATLEALKESGFVPKTVVIDNLKVVALNKDSFRVEMENLDSLAAKNIARSLEEVMSPVINQPYVIAKYEYSTADMEPDEFLKLYLDNKLTPYISSYHPVPGLLARSQKGREAFEKAWNEFVSPGSVLSLESKPEDLNKYFGIGPSVAQRMLWS